MKADTETSLIYVKNTSEYLEPVRVSDYHSQPRAPHRKNTVHSPPCTHTPGRPLADLPSMKHKHFSFGV